MPSAILMYVEHDGAVPRRTALEAATAARRIKGESETDVIAIALGAGAEACARALGRYGVDVLFFSESPVFDEFLTEPHVDAIASVAAEHTPSVIIFPDNVDGRDIAARLAARLGAPLVSAVTNVSAGQGRVDVQETVFGGQYTADVEPRGETAVLLLRANAVTAEEHAEDIQLRSLDFEPGERSRRARLGNRVEEEGAAAPLEEASVIVAGGRGLGGPEPFAMLEELAAELGGVVGASRAAVDAGWIAYSHQIGQTGRTVKPLLYVAAGISGAVQHRVGMQTADTIVAINRDAGAPIFQLADLGVVGDLFAIVPRLTEEIRRRKESKH